MPLLAPLHRLLLVIAQRLRRGSRLALVSCCLVVLTTALPACCREPKGGGPASFRVPDAGGAETASPADSVPATPTPEVPTGGDRRRDIARRVGRQRVDPNGPQFAAPALLTTHFKKHGEEMGFVNENDYLAAAQTLIGRTDIETFQRRTDTLYFRGETGEFAVRTERGIIRTYFLPGNPRSYWDRQKRGTEGEEEAETDLRKRLRR